MRFGGIMKSLLDIVQNKSKMKKYIVTIAPPTPNGNLHLGHISGPFLAADIFTRVRKQQGDEVVLVCYSDDYQDYVALKARQVGEDKFELATRNANQIKKTLERCLINLNWFLKAYQNQHFKSSVKTFYLAAFEKNKIGKRRINVPFSPIDNEYGYEAFARGICNYCGSKSDASQCEECANSPILEKMGDMISVLSNTKLEWIEQEREYLKIGDYKDYLLDFYKNNPIRSELREFIDSVVNNEEFDWYIDRPNSYGIDIQVGEEEKIIHTWFSGIAGYYAATEEYFHTIGKPEIHQELWMSKDTHIVNFLGFDCSFSHAIAYPILLSNIHEETPKITQITNRFLKLENEDFSTSRGHAIWVDDILEEVDADTLRFYLASISPEEKIENFSKKDFLTWKNEFFIPIIQKINEYVASKKILFNSSCLIESDFERTSHLLIQWKKSVTLEHFSIKSLAKISQDFLELIDEAFENNLALVDSLIVLFSVISKSIVVDFSAKLIDQNEINEHEIISFINTILVGNLTD